jgi:hypothetical protein
MVARVQRVLVAGPIDLRMRGAGDRCRSELFAQLPGGPTQGGQAQARPRGAQEPPSGERRLAVAAAAPDVT